MPPELKEIKIDKASCLKKDDGTWCLINLKNILTNDELLKNYIEKILTYPIWDK